MYTLQKHIFVLGGNLFFFSRLNLSNIDAHLQDDFYNFPAVF